MTTVVTDRPDDTTDGRRTERTDGRTVRRTDGPEPDTHRQKEPGIQRLTDGQMDRQIYTLTDRRGEMEVCGKLLP